MRAYGLWAYGLWYTFNEEEKKNNACKGLEPQFLDSSFESPVR